MRILVKIGGAQLEDAGARAQWCRAVAAARRAGHELVIVHGGGNQIRTLAKALGLQDRYHDGLRVTDAATAEVALMVLGGQVNRTLVAALQRAGVPAVGLSGADGGTFSASALVKPGVELGFVGGVDAVRPQLAETLLGAGYVPVIATVAPGTRSGDGDPFFNLNADLAAGPLCRAFGCAALLFLTDVPGVLDGKGQRLASLTPAQCAQLVRTGAATGGMLPKLDAAQQALAGNPAALIKIAPAAAPDAVLAALQPGTGTTFCADGSAADGKAARTTAQEAGRG